MLTQQQALFVKYVLEGCSGVESALKAGYSESSAYTQSSRLLSNDKIKAAIERKREIVAVDSRVSVQSVINELALIAFIPLNELKKQGVTTKNKLQALDMLCRHLSIYNDKLQVEHDVSDDLKKTLTSISSQHSNADLIPEAEEVVLIDDDSLIDPFALEDPANLPEIEEKIQSGLKNHENMGRRPTSSVQRLNTDDLIRE